MSLQIHPVTPDRWSDLEQLFGPRGACGGCWCMTWRKSPKEFRRDSGEANCLSFQSIVQNDPIPPGLIGYLDGEPVAWVAVAPRAAYPRLENSRILQPIDETPVWSVSCLFVEKGHRKQGITVQMIDAAAHFAFKHGASVVEGYPHDLKGETQPGAFVWTGLLGGFLKAGFTEVARRSPKRPIVRRVAE